MLRLDRQVPVSLAPVVYRFQRAGETAFRRDLANDVLALHRPPPHVGTRGKRLVVLVGQKKAVAIAVRNASGRRRRSKLDEWLAGGTGGAETGSLAGAGAAAGIAVDPRDAVRITAGP